MLFLLVRISPILIPAVYFFLLRALSLHVHQWYVWLLIILLLNLLCFAFLAQKLKRKRVWFILLYSWIFSVLGFGYTLLLSSQIAIYTFITVWSVIYLVYLESVFNYFYRTKKLYLIELKNITAYTGLLMFFLLVFSLTSAFIFFGFAWWLVLLICFLVTTLLLFDRFLIFGFDHKTNFGHTMVVALVLTEVLAALLWWTASAYVIAIIMSTGYYLLNSLTVLSATDKLSKKTILRYIIVAVIVLILTLVTAKWL